MHHAMQLRSELLNSPRERIDLLLLLDITQHDLRIGIELEQGFLTLFTAHRINDRRAGVFQHPPHMPSHALAIGKPHHKNRTAGQLQEVHKSSE